MKTTKIIHTLIILLIMQSTFMFGQEPTTAKKVCVSGNCVNGIGKEVYSNGDSYEGDFINYERHGQGTYKYKNGQIYVGKFYNNLRNGNGKFTFSDGSIYEGDFVNDNFIGHGTYTNKSSGNYNKKFTIGQIVDIQSEYFKTYWGKGEIFEIIGDKYKINDFTSVRIVSEQQLRPFTPPVKYEIGQKVEVIDYGIWYKAEIIANEVKYNDHYRVRYEDKSRGDQSQRVNYIRLPVATSNTINNASSSGKAMLSDAKEAAVDANIVAKKAIISSIMENAQQLQTNKERLQPAKVMLQLQKDLVQYLTDAVNGTDLSESAKSKYRPIIEKEKSMVSQLENLVKLTAESASNGL